jgi:hypothetical protein
LGIGTYEAQCREKLEARKALTCSRGGYQVLTSIISAEGWLEARIGGEDMENMALSTLKDFWIEINSYAV